MDWRGRASVAAAAALWGTTGTAQALGPDDLPSRAVGAVRLIVGAAAMVALLLARRGRPRDLRLGRMPVIGAGVAIAAYQLLLFEGVRRTGVSLGQVVGIGSTPLWAGLVTTLRRRPPGRWWLMGTALAVVGAALLIGGGGDADAPGMAMCIGAGLAYVVYAVALERATVDEDGAARAATVTATFVVAAVLLAPALVGADLGPLATGSGVLLALHLGVATVAVAYLLFARGLAAVGVAVAATLTLAEPLTAAVLGSVVLDEPFGLAALGGTALLLTGLAVASWSGREAVDRTVGQS